MDTITFCYSNHRSEILAEMEDVMLGSDMIVVEEPPHPAFASMLAGKTDIEDILLELDFEYPHFIRRYYRMLQRVHGMGKTIVQIEPFVEILLQIHDFFADGHAPEEIDKNDEMHDVYCAEKEATYHLIEFYKASRSPNYDGLLKALRSFARADAARFLLRDTLRADAITAMLETGVAACIEAGNMHRQLFTIMAQKRLSNWSLQSRFLEEEIAVGLGGPDRILSPGDELTLAYISGEHMPTHLEELLSARALIYSKIIIKEEIQDSRLKYPHLTDEIQSIEIVNTLSLDECRELYQHLQPLSTVETRRRVEAFVAEGKM
ncbi:MAG: hypothetical protein ABR512_07165 [Desulfopila sp.]